MKKGLITLFLLAFIFSFNLPVLADQGHSDGEDSHQESEDKHGEGTATSEHVDTDGHDEGNNEANHSSGDTEGEHEEGADEGHHGPVVETPPNYKVLGTYGAVNFSFILIGVWNKWFRRKGK
nr:hypothetical protein [Neobacillus sp. Marseille-Q6967]